ncbi:MAG: hypothetical protein AAFZ52_15315 [Bacteroidota bacterium]
MRSFFTLLLLFILSTCGRAQTPLLNVPLERSWEQSVHWEELNELDGRFRLLTPAPLTHSIDTVATELGEQVYHTFHLQAPYPDDAENIIYAISYVDYPAGSLHHDSLDLVSEFLATTEEEAAAALGGEIIYATDVIQSNYPARQWRIDYPSKGRLATARTLATVISRRYYEIKVFSLRSAGVSKAGDKFFDSLRLFPPDEQ